MTILSIDHWKVEKSGSGVSRPGSGGSSSHSLAVCPRLLTVNHALIMTLCSCTGPSSWPMKEGLFSILFHCSGNCMV